MPRRTPSQCFSTLPPALLAEGASDTFKGTAIHKLIRDMGAFGGQTARCEGPRDMGWKPGCAKCC